MDKSTDSSTSCPTQRSSTSALAGSASAAASGSGAVTACGSSTTAGDSPPSPPPPPQPPSDGTDSMDGLGCGPPATSSPIRSTAAALSTAPASAGAADCSTSRALVAASNINGSSCSSVAAAFASRTLAAAASRGVALPPLGAPFTATLQHTTPPHAMQLPPINLNISTTTGGNFGVTVDPQISVENLKKIISKKLKLAKDRICLLHREKELQDGTLKDNNLMDGSKIILIPNVETGLLAQRPENTVMQALESLNDSQVNDFLSGKTPLNLSMRLGDHMMLIQLQLSTVNPVNGSNASAANGSGCSASSRTRSSQRNNRSAVAAGAGAAAAHHNHHHHHHHHHHHATNLSSAAMQTAGAATGITCQRPSATSTTLASPRILTGHASAAGTAANTTVISSPSSAASASAAVTATNAIKSSDLSSFLSKRDYESLQNIVKSIAMAQPARLAAPSFSTTTIPAQLRQTMSVNAGTVGSCPAASATHTQTQRPTHVLSGAASAASAPLVAQAAGFHAHTPSQTEAAALLEQSPIKSLSNLVSSPIKTAAIKHIPIVSTSNGSSSNSSSTPSPASVASTSAVTSAITAAAAASCQDPIAAKLTSCLCTRLNGGADNMPAIKSACHQDPVSEHATPPRSTMLTSTPNHKTVVGAGVGVGAGALVPTPAGTTLLHKTANNPIARSKHRHHHHHHHHHYHHYHHQQQAASGSSTSTSSLVRAKLPAPAARCASVASTSSNDSGIGNDSDSTVPSTSVSSASSNTSATTAVLPSPAAAVRNAALDLDDSGIAVSDTRTLAEASRNLTQTLRKLSKEVFTNKIDLSGGEEAPRKSGTGAVIESMKNHGKGIYSGTFSGTLNPALQDRYGRPKRDISTVIHILNDLLSATPQYSRGARISFEAPSTSAAAAAAAAASGATSSVSAVHSVRSKQLSVKHHQHVHSCVKCMKAQVTPHSSSCAYGECNGHYVSKTAAKPNYVCCQEASNNAGPGSNASPVGSSNGSSSASNHGELVTGNERNVCSCRYRSNSETGEREREHLCQKCLIDMENRKTKSKLDQLRLVMQQRKQKREARKLKGAPYGARVLGAATATATVAAASANAAGLTTATTGTGSSASATPSSPLSASSAPLTSSNSNAAPNEVSPNHIVEEVDTAA